MFYHLFIQNKLALFLTSPTKGKPEYKPAMAEIKTSIYLTHIKMERSWTKYFHTNLLTFVSLGSCFPKYYRKRIADGTL